MDKDSKLIYEKYNKIIDSNVITESTGELIDYLAKVIDPTGMLSWGDFLKAQEEFEKDNSIPNLGILVLCTFCALPNFGLLAAGVGGAWWAGAKAAARAAIKAGPSAVVPAAQKILESLDKVPLIKGSIEKTLTKMKESRKLSDNAYNDLIAVLNSGKISDAAHGSNILYGRGGQSGIAGIGSRDVAATRGIPGALEITKGGARAASGIVKGETGVKSPFSSKSTTTSLDDSETGDSLTGRKVKR